ncbi:MAG TPA: hypothetical protein VII58_03975 [Acidobacteriaceae bacterium]
METAVLHLCGLWFWLTRRFRMDSYREASETLKDARAYLAHDFAARASTRDRGSLLPDQIEALALLERHGRFAARTVDRLESLSECCRFVIEELTGAPASPTAIALPSREVSTPVAVRIALTALVPDTRSGGARLALPTRSAAAEAMELQEAA